MCDNVYSDEVAKKMLKKGVDLATISEFTDLPIVELKKLK